MRECKSSKKPLSQIHLKRKCIWLGGFFYKKGTSIEERAISLAHCIIDTKDTVRGAASKFGVSKSTVHKDVTLKNGLKNGQVIPESIDKKKNK